MIHIVTGGEPNVYIDEADDGRTETETRVDDGGTETENRMGEDDSRGEIVVYTGKPELPGRPENWARRDSSETDRDEEGTPGEPATDGGTTQGVLEGEFGETAGERSVTPTGREGRNESGSEAHSEGRPPRLSCWLCRQPLAREESVRWRGEPVHPGCLHE